MPVLAIVHQRDAAPGVFAEVLRAADVELESWVPAEAPAPPRGLEDYRAVLAFGGAMHADQEAAHPWLAQEKEMLKELLDRRAPVMGVCLGAQLLAEAAGARTRRAREPEIGWLHVDVGAEADDDPVLAPLAPGFDAFQWHSYEFELPPGATPLARSAVCLQAFRAGESAWGIQFHAEVTQQIVDDWISDYRSDEDAVRSGFDEHALREQTRAEIGRWNEIGRGLCRRFLAAAGAAC